MPRQTSQTQPKDAGPKPPFPQRKQPSPGKENQMLPKADHGEESYAGHNLLQDKVAIITGADSGIGRAVAIAYAREGADVVLSFLPEEEDDARETERWVKDAGRKVVLVAGDVGKKRYCERLVQAATGKFGHLDILVNNAAFQRTYDDVADVPEEEFERTFRTNVFGTFYLSQAAAAVLPKGGSIVNSCSIQAFEPSQNLLAYSPTKAALVNMTKGMAKALAKKQIRVNGVAPGPVWTPLIPSTMPKEKVKEFGKNTVRAAGAACGAGADLRVPGVAECDLCYGGDLWSDRGKDALLILCSRETAEFPEQVSAAGRTRILLRFASDPSGTKLLRKLRSFFTGAK